MFRKSLITCFTFLYFCTQWGWSQDTAPKIEATGDQVYCPSSQIPVATTFNISDPNNSGHPELFIQISTGYVINQDELLLTGSHPNILASWNKIEGKLTLTGVGNAMMSSADLINAVLDVVFESTSQVFSNDRTFSFSVGNANYLPSTGHYYEFVPALGITWKDAEIEASNRTYYGLQGYLATMGSAEESQLAGEQASGAGWIGGTDEETEGVWKWATGPEKGTVFWNGGPNGSAPSGQYSNWNVGEPNNLGDEHYAHITAPGVGRQGSWNDLSNTGGTSGDYQPKGYIVEYGGMPGDPEIDISAYTTIIVNPIFKNIELPPTNVVIETCDSHVDGDAANGITIVNLTDYKDKLTVNNGFLESDYTLSFYTDSNYSNVISDPLNFENTVPHEQTIYVRMSSLDSTCHRDTSFLIRVLEMPIMPSVITYKNCDEDGIADGFTNFNLNEIDALLNPNKTPDLTITYHRTASDADINVNALIPLPFNNATASILYARVENGRGCYAMSTINLQVSTTSFPANYLQELKHCDDDGSNDGYYTFNLENGTSDFLAQFPTGQNLSVSYYEHLEDALLNQNKIQNSTTYINTQPYSQLIYIRVQSDDNGDCFGVGPHLQLTVNLLPEFNVYQSDVLCLGGEPVELIIENPTGNYTYIWTNEANEVISNGSTAMVASEGIYTVVATSEDTCQSVPVEYRLVSSETANLTDESIAIEDLSNANTITIDIQSLGVGDYEFSLGTIGGPYQDSPIFTNVPAGIHTLYANDKNGCGIVQLEVYVMGFAKFFTPNNDRYNDTWNLKGFTGQFSPKSYIDIYDRFGTFLSRISPNEQGWDGVYRGAPMPASDYWFVAHLFDHQGIERNFKGNFSLLR